MCKMGEDKTLSCNLICMYHLMMGLSCQMESEQMHLFKMSCFVLSLSKVAIACYQIVEWQLIPFSVSIFARPVLTQLCQT